LKYEFRKRVRMARLAVGLVALAVPFVGASVAQGAIGQSTPPSTAAPDLVSANIVGANFVQVCFDQPVDLAPGAGPGDVLVGGYKSGVFTPGIQIVSLGNNCIRTQITASDVEAYTIVTVAAGTVRNEADVTENLTDSTPLLGSDTQNGTRGNTTGPDLQNVILLGPENQIIYAFDQDIECDGAGPDGGSPGDYSFSTQNGVEHNGIAFLGCSDNVVNVLFAPADNVSQARSAWVYPGGAFAFHASGDSNQLFSVIAGGGGITVRPDLLSAELVNSDGSSDQMRFTFDEGVGLNEPAAFTAIYSDSPNVETGDSAQVVNNSQVLVSFTNLSNRTEYVVGGAVLEDPPGAFGAGVFGTNGPNFSAGKPAGDNAGAFALGWTTGPDAVSASVNQADGQVTVIMDQRNRTGSIDCAQLVNSDGQLFGSPSTATTTSSLSVPNVSPVTYQFNQNELAQAVAVYVGGPLFGGCTSLFSPRDATQDVNVSWPNVDQIFSIR
jgi:hypothetical protein